MPLPRNVKAILNQNNCTSCAGPPGPRGPRGERGFNGTNGTPGKNGTNGTNGKDGRGIKNAIVDDKNRTVRLVFTDDTYITFNTGKDGTCTCPHPKPDPTPSDPQGWQLGPALSESRVGHAIAFYGQFIYAIGGWSSMYDAMGTGSGALLSIEMLDTSKPKGTKWTSVLGLDANRWSGVLASLRQSSLTAFTTNITEPTLYVLGAAIQSDSSITPIYEQFTIDSNTGYLSSVGTGSSSISGETGANHEFQGWANNVVAANLISDDLHKRPGGTYAAGRGSSVYQMVGGDAANGPQEIRVISNTFGYANDKELEAGVPTKTVVSGGESVSRTFWDIYSSNPVPSNPQLIGDGSVLIETDGKTFLVAGREYASAGGKVNVGKTRVATLWTDSDKTQAWKPGMSANNRVVEWIEASEQLMPTIVRTLSGSPPTPVASNMHSTYGHGTSAYFVIGGQQSVADAGGDEAPVLGTTEYIMVSDFNEIANASEKDIQVRKLESQIETLTKRLNMVTANAF